MAHATRRAPAGGPPRRSAASEARRAPRPHTPRRTALLKHGQVRPPTRAPTSTSAEPRAQGPTAEVRQRNNDRAPSGHNVTSPHARLVRVTPVHADGTPARAKDRNGATSVHTADAAPPDTPDDVPGGAAPDGDNDYLAACVRSGKGQLVYALLFGSEKGGAGKTTAASNAVTLLGRRGRALAVDMDPQGALTSSFGAEAGERDLGTVLDPDFEGSPTEALVKDVAPGVDLLPSARESMLRAEKRLLLEPGGHTMLSLVLADLVEDGGDHDYAVIDTPSNLGMMTTNAVCAADGVLGVYNDEYWSALGVTVLSSFVDTLRRRKLSRAQFLGLINNRHRPRLVLSQRVEELVAQTGLHRLRSAIPDRIQIAEAAAQFRPVVLSDPGSAAEQAFTALVEEILQPLA